MQPQNVFLQTFIRDLVTNGVLACDSFLIKAPSTLGDYSTVVDFVDVDIWRVTSCMID